MWDIPADIYELAVRNFYFVDQLERVIEANNGHFKH